MPRRTISNASSVSKWVINPMNVLVENNYNSLKEILKRMSKKEITTLKEEELIASEGEMLNCVVK